MKTFLSAFQPSSGTCLLLLVLSTLSFPILLIPFSFVLSINCLCFGPLKCVVYINCYCMSFHPADDTVGLIFNTNPRSSGFSWRKAFPFAWSPGMVAKNFPLFCSGPVKRKLEHEGVHVHYLLGPTSFGQPPFPRCPFP